MRLSWQGYAGSRLAHQGCTCRPQPTARKDKPPAPSVLMPAPRERGMSRTWHVVLLAGFWGACLVNVASPAPLQPASQPISEGNAAGPSPPTLKPQQTHPSTPARCCQPSMMCPEPTPRG